LQNTEGEQRTSYATSRYKGFSAKRSKS